METDHANIRSAYAIYRTAEMLGTIDLGADTTDTPDGSAAVVYYFNKDGTISKDNDANAYVCKATAGSTDCDASAGCKTTGSTHEEGALITIKFSTDKKWSFVVAKPATGSP